MSDTLLDELLRQPDLESGYALLSARIAEVDRELLNELGAIGQAAHDAGRLAEAATVFAHGRQAAELAGDADYEAMFALGVGQALHQAGHEQAEEMLESARVLAQNRLAGGNKTITEGFVAVSLRLAEIFNERGEEDRARRLLGQTRRRCREIGEVAGELWAAQGLLHACLGLHDLRPARGYASILAEGLDDLGEAGADEAPDRRTVYSLLLQVAHAYYYDEDDFEAAAEVAAQAAKVFPAHSAAHVLRANALGQLERYEECAAEYEAALELPPVEAATHLNYGTALLQLNRTEDALAAVQQAVSLAPDEPRYRFVQGQINEALGRHEDALTDFGEAINRGRAEKSAEDAADEEAPAPRSNAAYFRNMSGRDLADFAQIARLGILRKLGRDDEALGEAEELIRDGDRGARYGGYLAAGEIHAANGRPDEAVASFTKAAELLDSGDAQLQRADVHIAEGRIDEAIEDLAFAAQQDRKPAEAAERLTQLLEQDPNDARLLKWRGYAYLESWRPVSAERDLTQALARLGDDPDLYLWRGLSRVTVSPQPDERSLEEPLTHELVTGAIEDLARAARLEQRDGRGRQAYVWLVDRVTADEDLLWWVLGNADEPEGLFAVVPEVRDTLTELMTGFQLEGERRWDEAVERYHAAQAGFAAAGLPVSALRMHMRLADNYTRLGALQLALDHLAELKRGYISLHTRPMTETLQPAVDEQAERTRSQTGAETAALELDFLAVYGIGAVWFMAMMQILEAELTSRVGDPARAVEVLGDIDGLRAAGALDIRTLLSISTILRDAGEYERALELIQEAEPLAHDPIDAMRLYNTAATIFQQVQQWETALQAIAAAEEIAQQASLRAPPLIMNAASTRFHLGQPQEALEGLDELDPDTDLRTLRDRYAFHSLRAQILRDLERSDDALDAVRTAVELADNEREGLRALDLRMSLQSRHATIYELGVEIAADAGDTGLAFELVEKSRSRAFVDQLAAGRLPLPTEAEELVAIERNLAELQRLLLRLNESLLASGPDFVDYELIDAAEELDTRLDLVAEEGGRARISAEGLASALTQTERSLGDLRARIEDARRSHATLTAGELVSIAEVRELLRA